MITGQPVQRSPRQELASSIVPFHMHQAFFHRQDPPSHELFSKVVVYRSFWFMCAVQCIASFPCRRVDPLSFPYAVFANHRFSVPSFIEVFRNADSVYGELNSESESVGISSDALFQVSRSGQGSKNMMIFARGIT